ncbi:MAG TPA: hypothetical protein VJ276_06300 [Thermoanaerobaculia bacterium]|nr:hypothetical protein [Thermoanaerobaculia bacterium]
MLVELDVFSGRPNPQWQLGKPESARLVHLIDSLEPADGPPPAPAGLGYRGFRIRDAGGASWRAYRGFVEARDRMLADPRRRVERFLLERMPAQYEELRSWVGPELGS